MVKTKQLIYATALIAGTLLTGNVYAQDTSGTASGQTPAAGTAPAVSPQTPAPIAPVPGTTIPGIPAVSPQTPTINPDGTLNGQTGTPQTQNGLGANSQTGTSDSTGTMGQSGSMDNGNMRRNRRSRMNGTMNSIDQTGTTIAMDNSTVNNDPPGRRVDMSGSYSSGSYSSGNSYGGSLPQTGGESAIPVLIGMALTATGVIVRRRKNRP